MDEEFKQLLNISERIGLNPNYCTLSGGNTSLKKDGMIYIKGSGQKLSDANKKPIFVEIKLNDQNYIEKSEKNDLKQVINNHIKPSIELLLHKNLPHKFVIHSHPLDIIALTIAREFPQNVLKKLNNFSYIRLPYVEIGEMLGKIVYQNFVESESNIFILGNHGLIVAHNNPIEAEKIHNEFIKKASIKRRDIPIFNKELMLPFLNSSIRIHLPDSDILHSLAIDPISLELCKMNPPYPDQIVFCGLKPLIVKKISDLQDIKITNEKWLIVENIGVFILGEKSFVVQRMLESLAEIYLRINNINNINLLEDNECKRINNMEQEKYRISILKED